MDFPPFNLDHSAMVLGRTGIEAGHTGSGYFIFQDALMIDPISRTGRPHALPGPPSPLADTATSVGMTSGAGVLYNVAVSIWRRSFVSCDVCFVSRTCGT